MSKENTDYPEPTGALNDDAMGIYRNICEHLSVAGGLMKADAYILTDLARWIDLADRAWAEVDKNRGVQVYSTGSEGVSAFYTVAKNASDILIKLATKFGLSTKDRELMAQFKNKGREKDDLDDI